MEGTSQLENFQLENFPNLVQDEDLVGIGKLLYGVDTADAVNERYPHEAQQARLLLQKWVSKLTCGETIDLCPPSSRAWYSVKLLEKHDGDLFHLHYYGWGKSADETVDLSTCWCLPAHTMTKPKKKSNPPAKKSYFYVEIVEEEKEEVPELDPFASCGTRSGRCAIGFKDSDQSSNQSEVLTRKRSTSPSEHIEEPAAQETKKQKRQKKITLEDEADWVCTECGHTEAPDDSDLLLCEGGCKRSFHLHCLGIFSQAEREKIIAGDAWLCNDCIRHRHTCAICHDEGDDEKV